MKVIPLDSSNLDSTIALLLQVFPYDVEQPDFPTIELPSSLNSQDHQAYFQKQHLKMLTNFVLLSDENRLIGTTGLYAYQNEPAEVGWLGWFCIDPGWRGQGLGKYLLSWTIEKARQAGFQKLRLYTSDHQNEVAAQHLYERLGFITNRIEPHLNRGRTVYIFKEKNLQFA